MTKAKSLNIDVRAAVSAAENYLTSLQDKIGLTIQDLRLEEVELSEDKTYWLITIGFNRLTDTANNPLGLPTIPHHEREYKIFKIDAETGEVKSMKIRQP
ncbi:hypothetical protein BCD67_05305 [Oscillatoriales cyanobacterium USR001]|nr:hypothetical protein BCD67_05305 [Oscillatoriales cyanobacterium USR001]